MDCALLDLVADADDADGGRDDSEDDEEESPTPKQAVRAKRHGRWQNTAVARSSKDSGGDRCSTSSRASSSTRSVEQLSAIEGSSEVVTFTL